LGSSASDARGNLVPEEDTSLAFREESYYNSVAGDEYTLCGYNEYTPLGFSDPATMYSFYRDDIRLGRKKFHKWQVEELLRVSKPIYTQDAPLKLLIRACNGSGKDSFFIAPTACWLAACLIRHKVIITSASYNQLSKQTEPYIRSFCEAINSKHNARIFDIKIGHIHCNLTGSDIFMFVTDEPGKAEGFHPYDDFINAEMTIILNEVKSLRDEIVQAFARCTGYTRWIEVSSPGKTQGHMYTVDCNCPASYPEAYILGKWYRRKITIYDCPHISQSQIEDDELLYGGRNTEFFRSKNLAEYTNVEERIVIPMDKVYECLNNPPPHILGTEIVGGLDLSGGGDETACASRNGNKLCKISTCHIKDATKLVPYLEMVVFPEHGFTKSTPIYTDGGGQGDPICDILLNNGWNIIVVLNQFRAANNCLYKNRGTEMWFNFATAVKMRNVVLLPDTKLIKQLYSRHYDLPDNDKLALLSKKEEKAEGNESPDRADAVVLCYCKFETSITKDRKDQGKDNSNSQTGITQSELVQHMVDRRFKGFSGLTLISRKQQDKARSTERDNPFSQYHYVSGMLREHNEKLRRN
jgi:hypothetical protein